MISAWWLIPAAMAGAAFAVLVMSWFMVGRKDEKK